MKLKLIYPVSNVTITQKYGENAIPLYKDLKMVGHNGLDFYAPDGTPVLASHGGVVTYVGLDGANGNLVVVKTTEQFEYLSGKSYYKTLYGHLKTGTFKVTAGQIVKAGDKLAEADNTGASTGSHLHFGLKPVRQGEEDWMWYNLEQDNGYNGAIDPLPFFQRATEFRTKMKKGDKSFEVEKLQTFLVGKKLMQPVYGEEFGHYGKKTAAAVYQFMKNTGKLSAWEKLYWRGETVGDKTLIELNK